MKSTTKKVTKLIRQAINLVDDKAEVILYGSRARGDEKEDSDWDILVLTDYPVNLEKEVLHIWPHTLKFDAIQKKYGRKIHFKIYHPENWATLESLDPDIKVKDILKEYEIPTYDEQIKEATELQKKYRV